MSSYSTEFLETMGRFYPSIAYAYAEMPAELNNNITTHRYNGGIVETVDFDYERALCEQTI